MCYLVTKAGAQAARKKGVLVTRKSKPPSLS